MLRPQVVVNLLPELRVCVNLMRRGFMVGAGCLVQLGASLRTLHLETNEFHKRLSIGVNSSKSARNDEASWRVATKIGLTSDASKLQVKLGDRVKRCLSEVKLSQTVFRRLKVRRDV